MLVEGVRQLCSFPTLGASVSLTVKWNNCTSIARQLGMYEGHL